MHSCCVIPVFDHAATAPVVRTPTPRGLGKFKHPDSISPATDKTETMTGSLPS